MAGLRERNRRRTMHEIQLIALDKFESRGFDNVTIEEIAGEGGVSASTVYRYFGTKEQLVVWDETDDELTAELVRRLASESPIDAFRGALLTRYGDEESNRALLRRVRFLYANPQVHAAAIEQELEDRAALAAGFARLAGRRKPSLEDRTRAGVCMAALGAAVEEWQTPENTRPLSELIELAFAAIDG